MGNEPDLSGHPLRGGSHATLMHRSAAMADEGDGDGDGDGDGAARSAAAVPSICVISPGDTNDRQYQNLDVQPK